MCRKRDWYKWRLAATTQDYEFIKQTCSELEPNLPTEESWSNFNKELWEKIDGHSHKTNSLSQRLIFVAAVFIVAAIGLFFPGLHTSSDSGTASLLYTPISAPEKSNVKHKPIKNTGKYTEVPSSY